MQPDQDLKDRVFIVTGANSGIGCVAARNFASRGAEVLLVCRNPERGKDAVSRLQQESGSDRIRLYLADFSDMEDVARIGQQIAADYPAIDVLCNNAGAANPRRQVTDKGLELTFAANHLGGFLFTQLLLPALLKSAANGEARVVFTSSLGHKSGPLDFDDLQMEKNYGVLKAYGRSKLMNLLTARSLHQRYGEQGLIASSFHPGAVRTPIWSKGGPLAKLIGVVMYPLMVDVEKGAITLIWLASSSDEAAVHADGHYFFKRQRDEIAPFATDEAAEKLWNVSMEMVQPYLN